MDFQQRLQKAIDRGQQSGAAKARAERDQALNEKEIQLLHTQYRLELSERIERCLNQLADNFPGFQLENIVGERGWGAAISRDNVRISASSATTGYSRLEMYIRPYTSAQVIELCAKGTIKNREIFNRSQYQPLPEADTTTFAEMIDNWALEFAELYARKR